MWLQYILGVLLGFYVTTKVFRHIVNRIIIGTLKIILWLFAKLVIRKKPINNMEAINQVDNNMIVSQNPSIVNNSISSDEFAKMLKDNPKLLVTVKR